LNFMPMSYGYPGLLVPLLVYAAIVSLWNDNHRLRTTRVASYDRQPPPKHFEQWLAQALKGAPTGSTTSTSAADSERGYPVFVVAAAGGGIRAAYWTALVLGTITDQTHADAWRRHLYAVSGVSGGSLGAAVHVVE